MNISRVRSVERLMRDNDISRRSAEFGYASATYSDIDQLYLYSEQVARSVCYREYVKAWHEFDCGLRNSIIDARLNDILASGVMQRANTYSARVYSEDILRETLLHNPNGKVKEIVLHHTPVGKMTGEVWVDELDVVSVSEGSVPFIVLAKSSLKFLRKAGKERSSELYPETERSAIDKLIDRLVPKFYRVFVV